MMADTISMQSREEEISVAFDMAERAILSLLPQSE
jgi:hypothetical protein